MEVKNRKPNIYIVAGKARHGKNTITDFMKDYADEHNLKCINLSYGEYIKHYAQKISNWDGSEETKPRELLQQLGTNIIRANISDEFFINKMIDDIKVYSYFFDIITISDARFPKEIDMIRDNFPNVTVFHVLRPNFDNGLSAEQKMHPSETALDNYNNYDYQVINDTTIEELGKKIYKIMGGIYE